MRTVETIIKEYCLDLSSHNLLKIESNLFTLQLFHNNKLQTSFLCSTARNGLGSAANSEKTPLGLHRICQKIGHNAPSGAIFKSREWTGEVWTKAAPNEENMILSRILRLEGIEEGINSGDGIDSYERYIYIHGTNQEAEVGHNNFSHGCIVLTNSDMIELFNLVEEGDYVYID